jgi:hypothetical protein
MLTEEDIQAGKLYRAKRFRELPFGGDNDRRVLWIGEGWKGKTYGTLVQYDSHTVRLGRHYPKTTMEAFLKWAKHEVVEEKSDES